MKTQKLTFFIFLNVCFLFLQACPTESANGGDSTVVNNILQVDSIVVLKNNHQDLRLKLYTITPNPCHEFSHIDIENENSQFFITPYTRIDKEVICITILGNLEMEMEVSLPSPGNYQFRFQGAAEILDTTFFVH